MFERFRNIVRATMKNVETNEIVDLETKKQSSGDLSECLFVSGKKMPIDNRGSYIVFRLDFTNKGLDLNGDPTLDADLYDRNDHPIKDYKNDVLYSEFGKVHHTFREFDPNKKLYLYKFKFSRYEIEFLPEYTKQSTITGVTRIVKSDV